MRHAHATEVNLSLEKSHKGLNLYIQDNGCGMDVDSIRDNPRSIGILGIQERLIPWQGQLHIHSSPDKGTQLHVHISNINALKDTP